MNFWDRINQTDVAGASARGFNAFAAGQEAAARGARNIEWSEQRPLRNLILQAQEEDAETDLKLGRQVNNALNVIAESRPELYNSNLGYMNALNAIAPLQEGQSRVLSEDGKTINIVGPDGQIMDSTPALKGKAAENALLDMSGLNLRQRTRSLPQEYQFEAQLNAQNARAMLEQQYKLAMLQAGLRGGGRGMGGGMGGAGKFGAMGLGTKPSDFNALMQWLGPMYFSDLNLPLSQNGSIDFSVLDPEQRLAYQNGMGELLQDYGMYAAMGYDPYTAGLMAAGARRGRMQGARNISSAEEQMALLQRAAQSVPRKGQAIARNARLQEGFQRQAEEARANFGRTSMNPFGG